MDRGTKPTKVGKVIPPCALCATLGHPTNRCSTLPKICFLLHAPLIPTPPTGDTKGKSCQTILCTNHPCALCGTYVHYIHDFIELPHYHDTIFFIHETMVPTTLPITSILLPLKEDPNSYVHIYHISTFIRTQLGYP